MAVTVPNGVPAESLARRAAPWLIIVVVIAGGITLCLVYGPQIIPFFGPGA